MNFKTRVHHLQKVTGWPYQKCLQALRNAGAAPAELAKANGWSLPRADVHIVAPVFVGQEQTPVELQGHGPRLVAHALLARIEQDPHA